MLQSLLSRFGLNYSPELLTHLLLPVAHIVTILVMGVVVLKLVDVALKRLWAKVAERDIGGRSRQDKRHETLRHIVSSFVKILIWGIAFVMVINELGLETNAVLTGAGILGLAVGFGAQSMVKDVIAGFFIVLEDQYGVGDSVKIGEHDGIVEHMTLRISILRNFEGHVHVIPNGSVSSVTVMTRDWARAVVDITVPHNVEISRLFAVLETSGTRILTELKDQVLDKPEILGIEKLSAEGATVRLAVKTLPSKRADVTREWRRLIREVLDKEGIELSQKKEI